MFFVKLHQNKGVNDLRNHITQILIGTSTSNMIHDTLLTKNPRPSKGRAPSYTCYAQERTRAHHVRRPNVSQLGPHMAKLCQTLQGRSDCSCTYSIFNVFRSVFFFKGPTVQPMYFHDFPCVSVGFLDLFGVVVQSIFGNVPVVILPTYLY